MLKTARIHLLTISAILVLLPCCFIASPSLANEPPASPVKLPGTSDLAAALSDPASRTQTLLTLIALSRTLDNIPSGEPGQLTGLEASFRDNRAWLDRLAGRYTSLPARSTLFDPAAWFIQQELGQHQIVPSARVSPLGPDDTDLMGQMFDHTDEELSAALLPEVLFKTEFVATDMWRRILAQTEANQDLLELLSSLKAEWLDPWMAAQPPTPPARSKTPAPKARSKAPATLDQALLSLQAQMASALLPQPPDELRVKRLRFSLLSAMPDLDQDQARTARYILSLTSAVDGLHDQRYLQFIQTLLWVVTDMLETFAAHAEAQLPLSKLLAEYLPQLSDAMARNFSEVDSRLNTSLAAAFDVVKALQSDSLKTSDIDRLRQELADSVTQFVLLMPEMAFYFDQPVRKQISGETNICISVAAVRDDNGKPVLTRKQFDGCLASILKLADTLVRRAELAGDPDGPFAADQLRRESEMAPWQRINYSLGYLHERSPTVCPMAEKPLPNPLEWSALATLMVWFSSQSPVYLQTPSNEAVIVAMRQRGLDFLRILEQQVDCINGSSGQFNGLINASLQQYQAALVSLTGGVKKAELAFRQSHLRAGADVDLSGDDQQPTSYRTPGLMIGPCDKTRVCEMNQPLEATRALVGQFPAAYLIADQTRLGKVEICYDNMQWVQRRMEPVRPEDPNVVNYYGHLSFDLVGRYLQGDKVTDVFGSKFVSPDEYYYLIAAGSEQILNDGCPTEWVGTRIVTSRSNNEGINIVPNRLTYLAAARVKPSEVINANWNRGAEWRDWFVTGIGVKELEFSPDPSIGEQLRQHLRALYQLEQRSIYSSLLRPPLGNASTTAPALFELVNDVNTYKLLLRNQLLLFYPEVMLDADDVRSVMEGQNGLLDDAVLRRFQENNIAIAQVNEAWQARLRQFRSAWKRQPDLSIRTGSVSVSVAHAITRLNALYREYFAIPAPVESPLASPAADASVGSAPPGS